MIVPSSLIYNSPPDDFNKPLRDTTVRWCLRVGLVSCEHLAIAKFHMVFRSIFPEVFSNYSL